MRDGAVHGPAMTVERLVSRGYTSAEKTLAANYRPGDTVAFHRPYKRLGVDKGDELRVASVDHATRSVNLEGADGRAPGIPDASRPARAGSRSTGARRSISAPATASAGPATMPGSGWSTAARPRSRRCATAG